MKLWAPPTYMPNSQFSQVKFLNISLRIHLTDTVKSSENISARPLAHQLMTKAWTKHSNGLKIPMQSALRRLRILLPTQFTKTSVTMRAMLIWHAV